MTDNDEMTFLKELKEKLKNKKADVEDDLKRMEDNIMTCETVYLENTEKCGIININMILTNYKTRKYNKIFTRLTKEI